MKKSLSNYLKIGQAAKVLGVSIDTLRRWEKLGKITPIRTPGGTRLFSLATLKKVNPASIENFQAKSLTTEELLRKTDEQTIDYGKWKIGVEGGNWTIDDRSSTIHLQKSTFNPLSSIVNKLLIGSAVLSIITLLITSWITASYLTSPKETQQFFKNNVAQGLLTPFRKLAEEAVTVISPEKAKQLGFISSLQGVPLEPPKPDNVLAVTSTSPFLEVNADTQINGSLSVRDSINGLTVEATPSASTLALTSGDTTLTVTKDALLDQDVSTTSSPTFNTLNLSATKDQLIFQSGGPTGTLTWTPTVTRIITLPDATGTVILDSATQTITNKTINASSNTITNIPNSALANSKITVTAGTNLTGGGDINLGSSATISLKDSVSLSGTLTVGGVVKLADGTAAAPALTFTDDTNTGLYRIGSDKIGLITGGSATSGITIDGSGNVGIATITPGAALSVSGNVGIGFTGNSATAAPNLGLAVFGNAGIGTTSPAYKLDVIGQINGSTGLCIAGDCKTAWSGVGGYTASNGLTLSGTDFQLGGQLTRATGIDINSQNFGFLGGNVGIGTSTPDYNFKVLGTGYFSGFVGIGSSMNVTGNVGVGGSLTVSSGLSLPNSSILNSYLVNSSINVTATSGTGISVSGSPVSLGGILTLAGIDASTTVKGVASFNSTNFSVSSGAVNTIQDIATTSSPTFSALTLSGNNAALSFTGSTPSLTSGANSFSIFSGGNVGIGTSANLLGALTVRGAGTGTNIALQTYGSNLTQGLTVLDNGNVGIGTTNPTVAFQLNSGRIYLPDGTAGSPVISFTNDTNTGIYRQSSDIISIVANGQNTFTASGTSGVGRLMIGNNDPVSRFQINDDDNNPASGITFGGTASTYMQLYKSGSNKLAIMGGNVGIGTSNPTATLQVQGNVGIGYTGVAIPSNGLAVFGNVGIGTTTANYNLSVVGTTNITGNLSLGSQLLAPDGTSSLPSYSFTNSTSTGMYSPSTNALALVTNGASTPALTITAGGNVGIGTTSPGAKLTISSPDTTVGPGFSLRQNGSETYGYDFDTESIGTGRLDLYRVENSVRSQVLSIARGTGNVGIGLTTANSQLSISNNVHIGSLYQGITAPTDGLFVDGNVGIGATTSSNKLDVWGGARITNGLTLEGLSSSAATALCINSSNQVVQCSGSSALTGTGANGGVTYWTGSNTLSNSVANFYWDSTNNRLGIGTSSPQYRLDVSGTGYFSGFVGIGSSLNVSGNVGIGTSLSVTSAAALSTLNTTGLANLASLNVVGVSNLTGNVGVGSSLTVTSAGVFSSGLKVSGHSDLATLSTTGNVGIGGSLTVLSGLSLPNSSIQNANLVNSSISVAATAGTGISVSGSPVSLGGTLTLAGIDASTTVKGVASFNSTNFTVSSGAVNTIQDIATSSSPTFSNLTLTGNLGVGGSLVVTGNVGVGRSLTVTDLAVFNKGITVTGLSNLTGNVGVGGSLTVTSGVNLSSSLNVTGNTNLSTLNTSGNITNAGVFLASDGSATAPAYSFINDTDSGLWRVGTNLVALTTGGTPGAGQTINGLSVNASGNVGIGTTSPAAKLHVVGGNILLDNTYGLQAKTNTGTIKTVMDVDVNNVVRIFGVDGNQVVRIANAGLNIGRTYAGVMNITDGLLVQGNVGIGLTTANSQLSISNNAHIGSLYQGTVAPTNGLLVDGNVGIGATTSANKLDVWGNTRVTGTLTVDQGTTFGGNLTLSGNLLPGANDTYDLGSNTARWNNLYLGPATVHLGTSTSDEYTVAYDTTNNRLGFNVNGSGPAEIVMDSSGNVGIGTTNPLQKLDIGSGYAYLRDSNAVVYLGADSTFIGRAGSTGYHLTGSAIGDLAIKVNSGQKLMLGIDTTPSITINAGNVGIGTTTVNSKLTVVGNAMISQSWSGLTVPTSGLFVEGNVGIGATTSSNKLDVWGNTRLAGTLTVDSTGTLGNALIGYSGVTAPSSGLAVRGNVGMGTTSPLGALHVVGQCVTWDTRIRIRRRRKSTSTSDVDEETSDVWKEEDSSEVNTGRDDILDTEHLPGVKAHLEGGWDYLEVMIKDILPGDEVLSLNENTQEFEYQRVEKLLDMGSKGVYELTTASGRQIKTTANHPYLVHLEGEKMQLHLRGGIEHQSPIQDAGWVKVINLAVGDKIAVLMPGLGSGTQSRISHNDNGQKDQSTYNIESLQPVKIHSLDPFKSIKLTTMQPNVSINPNDTINTLLLSTPANSGVMAEAKNTNPKLAVNSDNLASWGSFNSGNIDFIKENSNIAASTYQWDTIVSIKYLGYEHVYDLQIENTHNFLANDIVAHNTYINGNLGVGVASPDYNLRVNGTGYFSGFVGIGSSLNVSGNVGLGSSLTLTSAGVFSSGLKVSGHSDLATLSTTGNVGIGGSLTVLSGLSLPNSSIQNANLVNSSISVAATSGTGISVSGSPVSLGGTLTLAGIDASTTVKGVASFNSTNFSVSSGAVNTIQDIATSSSPTFSNLTLTGNLGVGGSLSVTGNVGVGRSLSVTDLAVFNKGITVTGLSNLTGNVGVGGSLTVTSGVNLSSSLNVTGNTNLSTLNTSGNITNAGVFLASDGSATAPAYSFINDTDSGLWRVGTNLVALTTGGTPGAGQTINGLSVNASGNVGIGTTGPGATLQVVGSSGAIIDGSTGVDTGAVLTLRRSDVTSRFIKFYPSYTDNIHRIEFGGNFTAQFANAAAYSFDGNVGIGTASPTDKFIVSGGNVGIGVSSPLTALAVNGAGTIGWGLTGVAGPSNGLAVQGNVGLGTTSPLGALHVVGQCVTWDTRIRIRRRRRKTIDDGEIEDGDLKMEDGKIDNLSSTLYPQNTTFHPLPSTVDDIIEYDYLEVIIKDILPGDEVLSLNENTQEFEYQRVEKLLDMGSKGVYELTTASGRQIKTTANHPYLVHLEGEKMQLHLRGGIEHQSPIQDAGWVKVINLSVGDKIAVAEELFVESNIDQKTNNHSQRESNSNSGIGIENIKFLVHNELLSKYAITNENIARNISIVNTANLFNPFSLEKLGTITTAANQPADKLIRRSANTDLQAGFVTSIYPTLSNQFMSVNQFMWDEIVSIKYLGYEHVYDLQIENTHNFLANDIVAHNTYINGSLGVGAYSGLTVPTNGLAVSGNVGIGTTTANSNLSIAGNAHIGSLYQNISAPANGLFVDGNVGIGATTSNNKLDVWGGARITNGLTLEGLSSSAATALCIDSSNQVVQCSGSSALTGTGVNGGVTYWTGSNTLSNSVANFYWDSTNNRLGIGTSSPQYRLDVSGTGYFSGFVGIGSSLNVSGNVGIGTSLSVTSAAALSTLNTTGLANLASLNVVGVSNLTGNVGVGSSLTVTSAGVFSSGLKVSGHSDLATLSTTGNVGIGGSLTVLSGLSLPNSSIQNANLVNSSISVAATAGTGISVSGSPVSLGGTLTLAGIDASTTVKGVASFNSTNFTVSSGAVNTIQDIATSSSPTFSNLTLTGNLGVGGSLSVTGNVGVGRSLSVTDLGVFNKGITVTGLSNLTGNVGVGGSLTVTSGVNLSSSLNVTGNTNLSTLNTSGNITNAGVFLASDGSATAPAYSFINDTDSGLWRVGTNLVALTTGGTPGAGQTINGLSVNASGNVGIGTTGPQNSLALASGKDFAIYNTTDEATNYERLRAYWSGNAAYIKTEKGGSGTARDLVVDSAAAQSVQAATHMYFGAGPASGNNIRAGSYFYFQDSDASFVTRATMDSATGYMRFGDATAPTVSLEAANGLNVIAGNVGIGTTTVNSKLTVVGNAMISQSYSGLTVPTSGLFVEGNVGIGATTSSNKLDVWGNTRVTGTLTVDQGTTFGGNLTLSGNLLPGANDTYDLGSDSLRWDELYLGPSTLHLGTSTSDEYTLAYDTTNNRLGFNVNGSGPAEIVMDSSGNVGIGTTNPQRKLDIGSGQITFGNDVVPDAGQGIYWHSGDDYAIFRTAGVWAQPLQINWSTGINFNPGATGITMTGTNTSNSLLTLTANALTSGNALNISSNSTAALNGDALVNLSVSGANAASSITRYAFYAANTATGTTSTNVGGYFSASGATNNYGLIVGNGNVGIGFTSPTANLHIVNTAAQDSFRVDDVANDSTPFTIDQNGNVGIGSSLTVTSAAALSTLNTTGLANLASLNVVGVSNLTGNVGLGSSLTVTSGVNLSSSLNVTGNTNLSTLNTSGNITNAGVFLASDGSATAPAYSFINDTDSGLWRVGTNLVALTTGGTPGAGQTINGLSVNASGNVGIGTTTVNSKLTVVGNAMISQSYSGLTVPTSGLFVEGNVGIGATTSANKLDVWGNTRVTGTLTVDQGSTLNGNLTLAGNLLPSLDDTYDLGSNTARWNNLYLGPSTVHIGTSTSDEYTVAYDTTNNRLGFNVNGSGPAEIVMDSSGNVGIGTTGPGDKLHVVSSDGVIIDGSTGVDTKAVLTIRRSDVTSRFIKFYPSYDPATHRIEFGGGFTASFVNAAKYAFDGNVGIGTTTPNSKLSVVGNAMISQSYSGLTVPTSGLFVEGNVGIGATTSANKLDVWGNTRLAGTLTVDSTSTFGGNLTLSGGQFLALNGTATLPSFSFTNSTSTGMYSPSANALSLVTNGASTPALTITAGGNVGIGTTAPFGSTGGYSSGNLAVLGRIHILDDNNTSTAERLNLRKSRGTSIVQSNDEMGSLEFFGWDGDSFERGAYITSSVDGTPSDGIMPGRISFTVQDTSGTSAIAMRIKNNGYIGIGTTVSPDRPLQINSSIDITSSLASLLGAGGTQMSISGATTNSTKKLVLGLDTTDNYGVIQAGINSGTPAAYDLSLQPAGGNVGIGTTSPGTALDLRGNLTILAGSDIRPTTDSTTALNIANAAGTDFVTFDTTNSRVGIGTASPSQKLDLEGALEMNGNNILSVDLLSMTGWKQIQSSSTTGNPMTFITSNAAGNAGVNRLVLNSGAAQGSSSIVVYEPFYGGDTSGANLYLRSTTNATKGNIILADDGGNVGIGTASPVADLHLEGDATSTAVNFLSTGAAGGGGLVGILDNGNVGIGNSSPSKALDVTGSIRGSSQFLAPDGTAAVLSYAFTNNTNMGFYRYGSNIMGTAANGQGGFYLDGTSGTGRVTIDYLGAAASKFHIQNDGNNATSGITLGTSTTTWMQLYKSGSNKLAIMGGNVGIGTSNPTATLQVQGNVGIGYTGVAIPSNGLAVFGNVGIGTTTANSKLTVVGNAMISQTWSGISVPTSGLFVEGNVGIGATTSSNKLDVWGNTRLAGTLTVDSTSSFGGNLTLASGQFLALNGTSSLPSYSFTNSTSTGMYSPSANALSLVTNGASTPALTITAGGNVGIGTTNPTTLLQIEKTISGTGITTFLRLDPNSTTDEDGAAIDFAASSSYLANRYIARIAGVRDGTGATSSLRFYTETGSALQEQMRITPSGNIGIGFTSPDRLLQVASDINIAPTVASLLGANGSQFAITGSTANNLQKKLTLGLDTTDNYGVIQAGNTNGTAYNLALNPGGGNVGIGTTSPKAQLEITSSAPTITLSGGTATINGNSASQLHIGPNGTYSGLYIGHNSTGTIYVGGIGTTATTRPGSLYLNAGTYLFGYTVNEKMRLTSGGNLGIGTSNPGSTLAVSGNGVFGFGGTTSIAGPSNGLAVSGNIGIGTTTTLAPLHVQGNGTNSGLFLNGNVGIGTTRPAAKFEVSSGTVAPWSRLNPGDSTFTVSSSKSLKENFNLVSGTGILDKISNVPVYTFDFINGSKDVMGLLAEDFNTIFGRGDASAINYQEVIMANWLGTQSLYQEVISQGHSLSTQGVTLNKITAALSVAGGNVGIGTTSPNSALDVIGNVTVSGRISSPLLDLGPATIASSSTGLAVQFTSDTVAGVPTTFQIKNSLGQNLFSIDASGSAKLAGTITTEAGAFDVAEDYNVADDSIEAGDVVSVIPANAGIQSTESGSELDPALRRDDKSPYIEKSIKPYDNTVVGVISTNPGITLSGKDTSGVSPGSQNVLQGSNEVNGKPVALTGRVPVKVSTENGTINVGDYLTSSSTPGVAMKATKPGTVIGKALESFDTDGNTPGVENCAYTPGVNAVCGKILMFINISFADPGNFLASLSLDDQGNMIIPKIRTSSLLLDPSVASASGQLTANSSFVILNENEGSLANTSLTSNDNMYYDLTGKIASLEDRIAHLEGEINKHLPGEQTPEATSSATASAQMTVDSEQQESTSSASVSVSVSNCTLYPETCTLNLTPPDILLANNTSKVNFGSFEVSEATVSGMLTAYQAQIQDNFEVFGETTLSDTLIAGNLTVDGTLSIENGSEINVIGYLSLQGDALEPQRGVLYLQKSPLAQGLDIFNGKVTIDKNGKLVAQEIVARTVTTNKLIISNTEIASSSATPRDDVIASGAKQSPSIGSAAIPSGQTKVAILTNQITPTSKVFITLRTSSSGQAPYIELTEPGVGFVVSIDNPVSKDIDFDWWIVEVKE